MNAYGASPGPGAGGSGESIIRKLCGFSNWMALMSFMASIIFGKSLEMADILDRIKYLQHLRQQFTCPSARRPTFAQLRMFSGLRCPQCVRRDIGVGRRKLHG